MTSTEVLEKYEELDERFQLLDQRMTKIQSKFDEKITANEIKHAELKHRIKQTENKDKQKGEASTPAVLQILSTSSKKDT